MKYNFTQHKSGNIYISRSQARARKITNEQKLLEVLKKYNFEIYLLENLSFEEQIDLFSRTKNIVAPHGAGLTNIVFTKNTINILELENELHHTNVYWNLGVACGATKYEILKCKDECKNNKTPYLRDMSVDLESFEKTLKELIAN